MSLAAAHDRAVLKALRSMRGKTVAHIVKETDLSAERVEAALNRLLELGDVRQGVRNHLWYPCP